MFKLKTLLVAGSALFAFTATTTGSAHAWGKQKHHYQKPKAVACYKKVHHPARYKTVTHRVMVKPESSHVEWIPAKYKIRKRKVLISPRQVSYHHSPAQYETRVRRVQVHPASVRYHEKPAKYKIRKRKVLVSKARHIAHTTPARYKTVHKTVLVKPAHTGWTIKHDKWGKKIHCQVEYPAVYKTVAHQKKISHRRTHYEKIPAQYRYVEERVLCAPPNVTRWFILPNTAMLKKECLSNTAANTRSCIPPNIAG